MGFCPEREMEIARGEVWWAQLPTPVGSEPGHRRPVLIIQDNDFNQSSIRTVIVAAFTANLRLAGAPGNVLVKRKESGLRQDSVVNVSQVLTIDKSFLQARVGRLKAATIDAVDEGIRLVLSL